MELGEKIRRRRAELGMTQSALCGETVTRNMLSQIESGKAGVSLDRAREPWLKAIESKGLVWINVSEFKFWEDESAKSYAVRSIPSNFLIASDGTIVARNLRGEELGAKLAELLD